MQMLKRSIGILLLLAFLSVKYTVLFSQTKAATKTNWSQSTEDPSKENKEKEEETKEPKSPFDELFYDESRDYLIDLPSRAIAIHYLPGSTTAYLSSWDLPPEA